ncbi:MAG: outer membrane lipoprotein-sorting protein [Chthoniobacteraceae bacterium]
MLPIVQQRCALIFILAVAARAEDVPDAREILQTVRVAHGAQDRALTGRLRTGAQKIPFKLTMRDGAVRWEFSEPAQTLVLRLGDKSSSLEEITPDGKAKLAAARFDDAVRGSDITYEDLAMRFLYWADATVEGEQTILLTKCWQLVATPGASASSYSRVRVWVAKETGALLKCEAFGRDGKLERTFRVVSGQKTADGLWILKQMRIESATTRPGGDPTPTYLEIDAAG